MEAPRWSALCDTDAALAMAYYEAYASYSKSLRTSSSHGVTTDDWQQLGDARRAAAPSVGDLQDSSVLSVQVLEEVGESRDDEGRYPAGVVGPAQGVSDLDISEVITAMPDGTEVIHDLVRSLVGSMSAKANRKEALRRFGSALTLLAFERPQTGVYGSAFRAVPMLAKRLHIHVPSFVAAMGFTFVGKGPSTRIEPAGQESGDAGTSPVAAPAPTPKYVHPCPVCGRTFATRRDATRHQRIHAKGPGVVYRCGRCGQERSRLDGARRHLKTCAAQGFTVGGEPVVVADLTDPKVVMVGVPLVGGQASHVLPKVRAAYRSGAGGGRVLRSGVPLPALAPAPAKW